MNNYEKKFVVRQAECILQQCNENSEDKEEKKISSIALKIENKRLKRKNIFWKISTIISVTGLIISLI